MKLELRLSHRSSVSVVGDDAEKANRPNATSRQLSNKSVSSSKHEDRDEKEDCCRRFTSCRWVIGYMCCAARFCQSAIRQCIGMAVVCMTLQSDSHVSRSTDIASANNTLNGSAAALDTNNAEVQKVPEFMWSPEFEGLILNAFNIGFFFSPIIGGHIAGKFGGKRVILVALLAGSITTICLPLAAKFNDIFVMILRIVAGFFLGVVDPAIQAIWARWAPKYEKAKLTTCSYTGLSLAGIVTFFISGHLCGVAIDNGWPFIFYFFGGFAFLCAIPWIFLVYDSPEDHPRILEYEQRLIAKGKGPEIRNKKVKTPWRGMLTSGPFWAIVVAHITYTWVTSWMMSYLPKYLSQMLKFEVEEDGLYSSLPYVGRLLTGILAGYLSDKMQQMGILSTGGCRKLFQIIGCIGCAGCTLAVGFLDNSARGAAVALLVLSMSFQNFTSVAFRINHLDIAPRFAGVMMGMTVTAAMGFSLTGPPITAAILKEGTQEEWLAIFAIVASLNIIGAIVFCIFGSGEIQDWAQPPKQDDDPIVSVVTISDIDMSDATHEEDGHVDGLDGDSEDTMSSEVSGGEQLSTDSDTDGGEAPPASTLIAHNGSDDSGHSTAEEPVFESEPLNNVKARDGQLSVEINGNQNLAFTPSKRPLSRMMSMPVLPDDGANKPSMLRKRISSSDLQQQSNDSKPRQIASTKPSLPTHTDDDATEH